MSSSVLSKIVQLQDILGALLSEPPAIEHWPEWTNRATAILAQFEVTLKEMQLQQGFLEHTVIVPSATMAIATQMELEAGKCIYPLFIVLST